MSSIHPSCRVPHSLASLFAMAGICISVMVPAAGAAVIATGTFQSKEAGISAGGDFVIEQTGGKFTLSLKSGFHVSEGPDLFFAFNPLSAAQVTGSNAKTYALKVDPGLKSLSGAQTYALPDDFSLVKYASLIVHCWKFNHLYAAAVVEKSESTALGTGKAAARAPITENAKAFLHRENGKAVIIAPDLKRYDFSGRRNRP